jgi:hypothetical protein
VTRDHERDAEWLLEREEGRAGAAPSPEAARVYAALTDELEQLPVLRAPAGWRERFVASLDEPAPVGRLAEASVDGAVVADGAAAEPPAPTVAAAVSRRWWRYAAVPLALAAGIALYVRGRSGEPAGGAIDVEVRAGDTVRRSGETPAVGDTLHVHVQLVGPGELRIYRNDSAVLARCPGHPACESQPDGDGSLSVAIPMEAAGRYRAAVIIGSDQVPVTGSLDGDVAAARARGARVTLGSTISAR